MGGAVRAPSCVFGLCALRLPSDESARSPRSCPLQDATNAGKQTVNLGKLSRTQMEALLHKCYTEQRAPEFAELHIPTPKKRRVAYTSERTGTGLARCRNESNGRWCGP